MSAINRGLRAASVQTLRYARAAPAFKGNSFKAINTFSRSTPSAVKTTAFSTMSKLQSGAPPAPTTREYDPEIVDIASYVHNTPIESDLAVSGPESETWPIGGIRLQNRQLSLKTHISSC
jgi:2-methylcitrate dehydratase